MILIINVCRENLHYLEFISPIEEILKLEGEQFLTKYYKLVKREDLEKSRKIIICGTSLKDNEFRKNLKNFSWIKDYNKPILGICAGMQIIGLLQGGKIKKEVEIGFFNEEFSMPFLGLIGLQKVYHLHNYYVSLPKYFESYCKSKIPQAVKHKNKEIYGVLFHPEVRQKDLIAHFIQL